MSAIDWTQYRGPTHDGYSPEIIRTNWAEVPPRRVWRVPIEVAWSSLTVSGGRVFTQVNRRLNGAPTEVCLALNADTGAELWAAPVGRAFYPDSGVGPDDGPRSTPTVDGDRVYVISSYITLHCLNAATGAEIWKKDFMADLGARGIAWQNAASPLIVGDLVLLNCNAEPARLCAVNKHDGSIVWRAHDVPLTHSTPIYTELDGVPQAVFLTQVALIAVAPDTGALRWRAPFPFIDSSAASPLAASNIVYCSAVFGGGSMAVQFVGGDTNVLWRRRGANMNYWSTPVHFEGHLYGNYGQADLTFRCVELATGIEKWRHADTGEGWFGNGGTLRVRDLLLIQTEWGYIVLVKPDPTGYREIARFRALERHLAASEHPTCWNAPAVSNGRVYARSSSEIACYDIAPPRTVRPQLIAERGDERARFRLLIANDDGSPVDEAQVARLEVLKTRDPRTPLADWTLVAGVSTLTNGMLRVEGTDRPDDAQGFFRVRQRP